MNARLKGMGYYLTAKRTKIFAKFANLVYFAENFESLQ